MKKFILVVTLTALGSICFSQTNKWTEADRKYLLDNLTRSRNALLRETGGLTEKQWTFKESPNRWSIAEIVEHIGIWELLLQREVNVGLSAGPQPELAASAASDSMVLGFIMEEKPHFSNEYTVPFTFAQPSGLLTGEQATAILMKRRNESIEFVGSAKDDLRACYMNKNRDNIHQVYITTFGHMDRHLRQIRKIKANKDFPK